MGCLTLFINHLHAYNSKYKKVLLFIADKVLLRCLIRDHKKYFIIIIPVGVDRITSCTFLITQNYLYNDWYLDNIGYQGHLEVIVSLCELCCKFFFEILELISQIIRHLESLGGT